MKQMVEIFENKFFCKIHFLIFFPSPRIWSWIVKLYISTKNSGLRNDKEMNQSRMFLWILSYMLESLYVYVVLWNFFFGFESHT